MSSSSSSACPHCRRLIDPAPKRSRLCPHCRAPIVVRLGKLLTEVDGAAFDRAKQAESSRKAKERAAERFREGRSCALRDLKQSRESGVVRAMSLLVSEDDCSFCQARRDLVIPIETCTVEMLPPYRECEYQDGCRSTFVSVLKDEYSGKLRSSSTRSSGMLGSLLGWILRSLIGK